MCRSEYGIPRKLPCPRPLTRVSVGFIATTPQKCAGTRMDPAASLPSSSALKPAAIAAQLPPLLPPGVRDGSHGLRVRPYSGFQHCQS